MRFPVTGETNSGSLSEKGFSFPVLSYPPCLGGDVTSLTLVSGGGGRGGGGGGGGICLTRQEI